MTYCAERTKLFVKAGRELATKLLPAPFALWFSDHDTGTQMTIVTSGPGSSWLPVWKGSIWHSSTYEFNDREDAPGLQPGFEHAHGAIESYFVDLAVAAEARRAERERGRLERDAEMASADSTARDAVMKRVALSAAAPELYEALESCIGHLEEMLADAKWHPIGHCPVLDKARAVMAKARGEGTDR